MGLQEEMILLLKYFNNYEEKGHRSNCLGIAQFRLQLDNFYCAINTRDRELASYATVTSL